MMVYRGVNLKWSLYLKILRYPQPLECKYVMLNYALKCKFALMLFDGNEGKVDKGLDEKPFRVVYSCWVALNIDRGTCLPVN